jgi:hypothetical protein
LLCQHQGGIRVYDRRFEIHKRVLAKEGGVVAIISARRCPVLAADFIAASATARAPLVSPANH